MASYTGGQLSEAAVLANHGGEDLECGDEGIAGRIVFEHNDVARGFAAEEIISGSHFFDDVPVADFGVQNFSAVGRNGTLQPAVGHDGGDHGFAGELIAIEHIGGQNTEDGVSVEHLTFLVGKEDAVAVTVEGDSEVGFFADDFCAHGIGMHGSASFIDVDAVGFGSDGNHFRAQFGERH